MAPSSPTDSVRPHGRQPTRLPIPGILQARTLEWIAISFSTSRGGRHLRLPLRFGSDHRVPAELGQESHASSCLRKGTPLASRQARIMESVAISFSKKEKKKVPNYPQSCLGPWSLSQKTHVGDDSSAEKTQRDSHSPGSLHQYFKGNIRSCKLPLHSGRDMEGSLLMLNCSC